MEKFKKGDNVQLLCLDELTDVYLESNKLLEEIIEKKNFVVGECVSK